ncbi:hypothetical protein LOTGIDRAFT_152016 [Lottia gigantea]|uniref:Major facilitator superfamily (MFS) profile domain-containing protein n=1 Tax=Lottia gigantea TaxID=225164 RepID=V4ALZ0_LOTGI|nr:hypothetical protein LOTGIDRAFT_152016 [Lottia gigantea]ESP05204.1 hypothetical protein LOTGIDRAFT_152016 [Lottia gigantea]
MYFLEPDTVRIDTVLEHANIINQLQAELKDDGTKTEYEIITRPIALYPKENCAYDNYSFLNDEIITRVDTKSPETEFDEGTQRGTDTRKSQDLSKPPTESTQCPEDIAVTVSVSPSTSISTKLKVIVTVLNCAMTACSIGFVYSLSVMFVDIIEEFQSSRAETSSILSISSALMFALGGVWGPLMTKFNSGYICMAGGLIILIGCLISAFTTSLPLLIASLGGLTGIGLSIPFFLAFVSVPEIYNQHSYIMMSVVSIAPGIGSCAFPYVTLLLMETYGWRGALLIIGAIFSNCIPIGLINGYVKKRLLVGHGHPTINIRDLLSLPLFKNTKYLISVSATMFFSLLGPTTLQVYVDMITEKGFSLTAGSVLLSTYGFSDLGGRVIGLVVFPQIKLNNKIKWAFCIAVLSITPLLYTIFFEYEYLLAITILFGLSWGMSMSCYPSMIMESTGPKHISSALGYCNFIDGAISLLGGPAAGLIKDATDSYTLVYHLATATTGMGSLVMVMMLLKLNWTKKRGKKTPVPVENTNHI